MAHGRHGKQRAIRAGSGLRDAFEVISDWRGLLRLRGSSGPEKKR